jgi:pyridoxine 5-phosphate synthase
MREAQRTREPDPAQGAVLAELAGAEGISVQVRRDRRRIRDRDLYLLREVVQGRLIVEMPPTEEIIEKIIEIKPSMVTLVADQADTDAPVAAVDFNSAPVDFGSMVKNFEGAGIGVAFLVEPDNDAVRSAARAGASAVCIDCSTFTLARTLDEAQRGLDRIDAAARAAVKAELTVIAGRGINYRNVQPLVELGLIDEFHIGHAIASRAILVGLERAVTEMLQLIRTEPRSDR